MLRRLAAHVAPAAAEQPAWRRYDFDGGEEAPPSGTVWGRSIPASSWEGLSFADRVRHLEVEGFVVLPRQLPPALVRQLQGEVGRLDQSNSPDYSDKTFGAGELATQLVEGRLEAALTSVPAHPPTVSFLSQLFGEPPLFMAMDYTQTDPGFPGISLHCDGQPWGIAEQFGKEFSSPRFLKCLYALDDTTEDVSAFKVVPRSHLSFHADANPYQRYEEHPECVKVLMNAGDCVVFSGGVFHGNFPHTGDRPRRVLAVSYRPEWAGPMAAAEGEEPTVPTWDEGKVALLPPPCASPHPRRLCCAPPGLCRRSRRDDLCPMASLTHAGAVVARRLQELLRDRNSRVWWPEMPNKSPDFDRPAPGLSPSRHGTAEGLPQAPAAVPQPGEAASAQLPRVMIIGTRQCCCVAVGENLGHSTTTTVHGGSPLNGCPCA